MEQRTLTYFIADLHLGAGYIADERAHERRVVAWLRSIAPTAKRLYLLGDILDYWYEYRTVVPRGYTRFFGALAEMADAGTEITWFKGNHDIWIFGYLQEELGIRVVDNELITALDGKRFFMAHGDGVGRTKRSYRLLRTLFRSRVCQWLYGAIHPRWTIPFAHGWSRSSRGNVATAEHNDLFGVEADQYVEFAEKYLAEGHKIDYFVFGHKHLMVDYPVGENSRLLIVGDWIRRFSYAVWDGETMRLRIDNLTFFHN